MGWRSAHGSYRSKGGQTVAIEVLPADELAKPDAEKTAERVEEGKRIVRPFKPGNKASLGRRPKLASLGINTADVETRNKDYADYLRLSESYRRLRIAELRKVHGYVSSAAMALVASASLQLGMSRYLITLGAKSMDMDLLKKGSALAQDARQNELAAWELASREAASRAKLATHATPWLANPEAKPRVSVEAPPTPQEDLAVWQTAIDSPEEGLTDEGVPLKEARMTEDK